MIYERLFRIQLKFANGCAEIILDFTRVLVRIDLEVAKATALSAKGNMEVDPERSVGRSGTL